MRRWEYPILVDQRGLALHGESLEALMSATGFDVEDVEEDTDKAWPMLLSTLRRRSTDEWRGIIRGLDSDHLLPFAELLKEHASEAVSRLGKTKYVLIRGEVFRHRLSHPAARWRCSREVAFEQARLRYIREDWRMRNPLKPPIPYAKRAKIIGVTDKTIKKWEQEGVM